MLGHVPTEAAFDEEVRVNADAMRQAKVNQLVLGDHVRAVRLGKVNDVPVCVAVVSRALPELPLRSAFVALENDPVVASVEMLIGDVRQYLEFCSGVRG